MTLFRRGGRRQVQAEGEVVPAWDTSLDRVHELIRRPEHARIWVLTASDLDVLHVLPPPSQRMDEAWIREAAAWWARRSKRRTRLVAMARHMALWHRARGEQEESALCATLARMTEKRLSTSPLAIAMLERAFLPSKDEPAPFADPELRRTIREAFFARIRTPKGKDLARLDFTEAAYVTLADALAEVDPAPLRAEVRLKLAAAVADAFVQGCVGKKNPASMPALTRKVVVILRDTLPMSGATANDVASYVLSTLDAFLRDICSRCPVHCVAHPRAHFAKPFASDTHPALDADDVPF